MNDAGQYLIWLPVAAALAGGVIGSRGSLKRGLRFALIAYASCVVAFQHVEFVQKMLKMLLHVDVLPYEAVFGTLAVAACAIWETSYQLLWRPTAANGNAVRRTGGLVFGAAAGWVVGTALFASLIAVRVVDSTSLYGHEAYLNILRDTMDMLHRAVIPLLS